MLFPLETDIRWCCVSVLYPPCRQHQQQQITTLLVAFAFSSKTVKSARDKTSFSTWIVKNHFSDYSCMQSNRINVVFMFIRINDWAAHFAHVYSNFIINSTDSCVHPIRMPKIVISRQFSMWKRITKIHFEFWISEFYRKMIHFSSHYAIFDFKFVTR